VTTYTLYNEGEESMQNDEPKSSAKERWGERVIIVVLILAGIVLILASSFFTGLLRESLATIGLNFLSSAAVTIIILSLVGSDVGGLKQEINNLGREVDKLHNIKEKEIDIMLNSVGSLSALLSNAYSLGIVGLGRSKQSANFEGNKNFVERWKYLLEYAQEVDVICFADRSLFYDIFNPFFVEKLRGRMEQGQEKRLRLRIILTSLDNPYNKEINEWSGTPRYMESRLLDARNILKRLCGDKLGSDVVREHKSFVPFTLLRGDNYMLIMFYIPGHSGGPVLEIRPLEMIAYPRITNIEDDKKLFQIYQSYFEDMWQKYASQ
jgi:hypothetical protein